MRVSREAQVRWRECPRFNANTTVTVKTTAGPVTLQRPKLRDSDEAFCSRLFGAGMTRTNALESLVISGWVRGLSDRDIEAALAEALGPEAALSKSTVTMCAYWVESLTSLTSEVKKFIRRKWKA